jgi:DNA-binding transcriptional LysR family regulator
LSDEHLQRNPIWQLQTAENTLMEVPYHPRLVCDDRMTLLQSALQGIGVVQMPAMLIAPYMQDGRLVDVAPGWNPRPGVVHAVFPSRRGLVPAVRALLDFLGQEFVTILHTPPS